MAGADARISGADSFFQATARHFEASQISADDFRKVMFESKVRLLDSLLAR
jgi:hypothetical protein